MENNWTEKIDRYIREGRTVSGGCGASSGLKAAASSAQTIASNAASEAQTVFGASSTVFNNLIGGLQRIVTGGPSQQGMSAGEFNASQAAITQNTAALARNLKGAAGSAAAAIGGGNTVTPAGGTEASLLAADTAAAEQGATAQNQLVQNDYNIGRQNYNQAVGEEMQLPNVFGTSTGATNAATGAQGANLTAQQAVNTENNWWQPMVTAAVGGVSGALTGGLTGGTPSTPAFPGGAQQVEATYGGPIAAPTTTSDVGNQLG